MTHLVSAQQPRQDEGCSIYNLRSLTGVNCNQFEHGEWLLVFEDNFDGSQINSDIWFTCEDNWNRRHGTELQYYKDENIVVDNGILHLVAREEPGMYPVWVFEVKANQKLKLFAENEVEIKPETEFYYGSNVEIHINSDTRASETTLINDTLVYYNQGFGSASETEQDDISIIPNPSNGHFSINLNSQWKRYDKLLILNQKGNVILERSIGDLQKYDFSLHAATGTYYILIEGAKGLVKKKLIIK